MGLGHGEWSLSDKYNASDAYHPALTTRMLGDFRYITVATGNDGVGVHDIMTNGRNGFIRIRCKLLLEPESQQGSSLERQNAR